MTYNSRINSNPEHLLTISCQPKHLVFVGLTPDAQALIVGEQTKIQLWDLSARQEVCTLIDVGRGPYISNVAVSADGSTLVCDIGTGIIKVWSLQDRQQRLTFRAHHYHIRTLALSHNGRIMASFAYDFTLKVWNLKKGRKTSFLTQSESDPVILHLACTPDGQTIAYSMSSLLKIWQWKILEEMELEGHSNAITTVAISTDGQTVFSGSYDRTIKAWELATGQEMYTLVGHSNYIRSIAISGNGQTLISSDSKQQFKLWNLATGGAISTWEEYSEDVDGRTFVAISADGRILACGSGDTVTVWRVL